MPSTRNGWSSSIYERSSIGNRVGRDVHASNPSNESLRQRLLVSMKTGDSRQTMSECRNSYIHNPSAESSAEAMQKPCKGHAKASGGPTMPSRASVGDRDQGRRIA